MTTFTPSQIQTAKVLVRWLVKNGIERGQARLEVANILTRYKHSRIKYAMSHKSCTSPYQLKLILEGREAFKEKQLREEFKTTL